MVTKNSIEKKLDTILDPELGISILQMGLIYDILLLKKGHVKIVMTLTSIGCPLYEDIRSSIEECIRSMQGVTDVTVELTFEPPWTPELMSKKAKVQLGFA